MEGIQQVFREEDHRVELQVEYLDTKRYIDPAYFTQVFDAILHYKLAHQKFDLVLVSDNDALSFVLDFRSTLFAETPIVFCGINNFKPESFASHTGITGVAEYPSFRETIEYARQFHPATRKIVVIGDPRTMTGRENREMFSAVAPLFEEINFEYWDGLPIDELVEKVASLSTGTVVFINGEVSERSGRILPNSQSTSLIRKASEIPLYSLWDFFLGDGIVGGKLVSGLRQGEVAARLALRILEGENPDDIPVVVEGINRNMFDYRQLQAFGIPLKKLPPESLVVNTPPPFYALSKGELWVGLGGLLCIVIFLLAVLVSRKRIERELLKKEGRVRLLLDSTAESIYGLDLEGNCTFCNRACVETLGYKRTEDLLGKKMHSLVHHARSHDIPMSQDECPICRVAADGQGAHAEGEIFRRADGRGFPVEYWSYPVMKDGKLSGLVVTFIDITERKEAEESLKALNRELDAFVYTLSHDLSTPLTAIIGFAELLRDNYGERLGEEGMALLSEIEEQGRRMDSMKDDLLTLAKMGKVPRPKEPVDVDEVVREVLREWGSRTIAEGLDIDVKELPLVSLPKTLLREIFENLIGNAVRYGAGSRVEIGGQEDEGRVRFYVRDHGPGIPESERDRIFEVFYRGTTGRGQKGSGIGLATVRKIARLYGGRAWVEETPGGGSTFLVEVDRDNGPEH